MWRRNKRRAFSEKAIAMLGGKCAAPGCSITDPDVLQIDHVHPEMRQKKMTGGPLREAIAQGLIPVEGLQLLCANHHAKKTRTDQKKFGNWKSLKTIRDYPQRP